MKKLLILLAAATLTAAGTANAQTTPPASRPAHDRSQQATPEQQADRLTRQLGLSADQRTRLVALEQARRAEMKTMRGQLPAGGTDRTAMRQTMQTARAKYDAQLKDILTAEQYSQYRQQREERAGGRGGRKMKLKAKS